MLCMLLFSQLSTKKKIVAVMDNAVRRAMLKQLPHDGQMQVLKGSFSECSSCMFLCSLQLKNKINNVGAAAETKMKQKCGHSKVT